MSGNANHAIWTSDFGSEIQGSSAIVENHLDLLNASYGSSNTQHMALGGHVRGPGSVEFSDIMVARMKCAASTKLASSAAKRTEIPKIQIFQYTRDGTAKPVVKEIWTLTNCYVADFQKATDFNDESFRIWYELIMVDEYQMEKDGTLKPCGTWGYNRLTHEVF